MKITFNDEVSGTIITVGPDKLNLANSPEGAVLTFGGWNLLCFKGVSVQVIPPAVVTPAVIPAPAV